MTLKVATEAAHSTYKNDVINTNDQWYASIHFTIGLLKGILAYHLKCVLVDVIFV